MIFNSFAFLLNFYQAVRDDVMREKEGGILKIFVRREKKKNLS